MGPVTEPPPYTACAVCGHPLNAHKQHDGTFEYSHADPADDTDHVTVPVPAEQLRLNLRCDFCMDDGAPWLLPVEDYEVAPGNLNRGDWTCCTTCADLIRADRWSQIITRARDYRKVAGLPPLPRRVYDSMYRQLSAHITGPIRLNADAPPQ